MSDVLRWMPPGERIIWASRPHPLFIFLRRLLTVLGLVVLTVVLAWLTIGIPEIAELQSILVFALAVAAAAVLMWSALVWLNQQFILTDRRAIWGSGVFRRLIVEVPLERIQNVAVYRSLRERIFGLGTIGITTAGTGSFEIAWPMVPKPVDVHQMVLTARDQAQSHQSTGPSTAPPTASPRHSLTPSLPPIIGLAGAIGAGKSEAAAAMARHGCLVLDADRESKAALERPDIQATLRAWWGDRILTPDGRTDRRVIASIVFADAQQRRRLEGLIHPIVQQARAEAIARVRAQLAREGPRGSRPRAIIIDAPLLFEAGVDRECDAVVFVDAPRDVRLQRLAETRGWDAAELARREAAQLATEDKKRRSQHILTNAGSREDLDRQIRQLLDRIAPAQDPDTAASSPP